MFLLRDLLPGRRSIENVRLFHLTPVRKARHNKASCSQIRCLRSDGTFEGWLQRAWAPRVVSTASRAAKLLVGCNSHSKRERTKKLSAPRKATGFLGFTRYLDSLGAMTLLPQSAQTPTYHDKHDLKSRAISWGVLMPKIVIS